MKLVVTAKIYIEAEDDTEAEAVVQAALDNMVGGDIDLTEVIAVEVESQS
jgi:hypothetical protein